MTQTYFDKVEDNQLYWHILKLKEWSKNRTARTISQNNYNKLKDDIALNGVEEEFSIGEDGVVYDGNNRLRVLQELIGEGTKVAHNGRDLEWVPVKLEHPKTEADKWRIALRGNEHFATWDADGLNNFLPEFEDEIDLTLFNITFAEPKSINETLEDMESRYNQTEEEKRAAKEAAEVNPNVSEVRTAKCPECGHEFEV